VAGLLPGRVFVASALVRGFCANDDELAMVMGHELAHTILDHAARDLDNMASAAVVQLVVLSLLDPTGLGTLLFELLGAGALFSKYAYLLPAKRCAESEADALGLTLVAKARYSPARAICFFERLHALEHATGVTRSMLASSPNAREILI
jgi:predicted Zn-dependent protease